MAATKFIWSELVLTMYTVTGGRSALVALAASGLGKESFACPKMRLLVCRGRYLERDRAGSARHFGPKCSVLRKPVGREG